MESERKVSDEEGRRLAKSKSIF
jgi:predicted P-type ATPase